MRKPRFDLATDGKYYTTVRCNCEVSKEFIDTVNKQTGWGLYKILDYYRDAVTHGAQSVAEEVFGVQLAANKRTDPYSACQPWTNDNELEDFDD